MEKKYPVYFSKKSRETLKRSISVQQMELLFLICVDTTIKKKKKRLGEIVFAMRGDGILTIILVKKVPFHILRKFKPEKQWTK